MKGSIIRLQDRGFGFIKPEDGGDDVFFHASALVEITFDDLSEGDTVSYDVEAGPKGPAATNVTKATGDAPEATEAADAAEEAPEATEAE